MSGKGFGAIEQRRRRHGQHGLRRLDEQDRQRRASYNLGRGRLTEHVKRTMARGFAAQRRYAQAQDRPARRRAARWYLATCPQCTPVLPQPFRTRAARREWVAAHTAATWHLPVLSSQPRAAWQRLGTTVGGGELFIAPLGTPPAALGWTLEGDAMTGPWYRKHP